jgi:hypothetical protein
MTYTPRELYDFIQGEIYAKRQWLAKFGTGKSRWPEHVIEQKQEALRKFEFMASAYERKFERESA